MFTTLVLLCLFIAVLRPTQEYFTHMETSPNAVEGLQILTYAQQLRPLSSEGSLTCQHLLRHGTLCFTVSSEGAETDQCSQRDSNSSPHDPKSSALPTEPQGRLYMTLYHPRLRCYIARQWRHTFIERIQRRAKIIQSLLFFPIYQI